MSHVVRGGAAKSLNVPHRSIESQSLATPIALLPRARRESSVHSFRNNFIGFACARVVLAQSRPFRSLGHPPADKRTSVGSFPRSRDGESREL
jgi:hypothetical protein